MDVKELIAFCHERIHEIEQDNTDTLFFTLTRRDVWLICLSALVLGQTLNCLDNELDDLLIRLAEVTEIQKEHWRRPTSEA